MKTLILLLVLSFSTPVFAYEFYVDWQAAYSPPGGDAVVGGKIARYVIDVEPNFKYKWFKFSLLTRAYGVTGWISPDERGHGLDKFDDSYAWKADSWRFAITPRIELGSEKLNFFVENYSPIDRHGVWEDGHGMETEYYWLWGVSGRFDLVK